VDRIIGGGFNVRDGQFNPTVFQVEPRGERRRGIHDRALCQPDLAIGATDIGGVPCMRSKHEAIGDVKEERLQVTLCLTPTTQTAVKPECG
jgi:hypothetical protein